jgi:sulfite oxidase
MFRRAAYSGAAVAVAGAGAAFWRSGESLQSDRIDAHRMPARPAFSPVALSFPRTPFTHSGERRAAPLPVDISAAVARSVRVAAAETAASPNSAVFTRSVVAAHDGTHPDGRLLVTFEGRVFDVSDWLHNHPGGPDKIRLAAGKDLAPFFAVYGNHFEENTMEYLDSMAVGVLDPADVEREAREKAERASGDDPFASDPVRSPLLKVHSQKPMNAELPRQLLWDKYLTPSPLFFVRGHHPVPDIAPEDYVLTIDTTKFPGGGRWQFTLAQLQDERCFPRREIVAALQCGGSRRQEFAETGKPVRGLPWENAIGNATWGGVYLRDVLRRCGVDEALAEKLGVEHVVSEGADVDGTSGTAYSTSIPRSKAFGVSGDVLLAFEMNGETLPRDHGFPVRLVVPGTLGARNVKWVRRVTLDSEEADSHWQRGDYRVLPAAVENPTGTDWRAATSLQDMPVTSAITSPPRGATVNVCDGGELALTGYAYSGAGRDIVRVEVSADQGRTWHQSDLLEAPDGARNRRPQNGQASGGGEGEELLDVRTDGRKWGWRLWEASLPVPAREGEVEVWCRAVDTGYNTQPSDPNSIWNIRGLLNNSYHRLTVRTTVKDDDDDE